MASTPGIARALRAIDAQHYPRDLAHGLMLLDQAIGELRHLRAFYPDDPALAAEDAISTLRRTIPLLTEMRSWAEDIAHQSLAPAPVQGARID